MCNLTAKSALRMLTTQHPVSTNTRRVGCAKPKAHKVERARKAVQFQNRVQVKLRSISQTELTTAWYNSFDYQGFVDDARCSLKAVTMNLKGDEEAYDASIHCLRGLEAHMSIDVNQKRRAQKKMVVQNVLNQQHIQRLLGDKDPEGLALTSRVFSKESTDRALLLAAFDSSITR